MKHITQFIKIANDNHHCSSITFGNTPEPAYIIAFYHGQECRDNQRVSVYVNGHHVDLEPKTGNPIVWNENGKVMILYSKFTDADKDGNPVKMNRGPVERWQYCENYLAEVTYTNKIELKNIRKIDDAFGLLARCQPVKVDGKTLIPLYREKDPICEIWEYDNNAIKKRSEFGAGYEEIVDEFGLEYNYLGNGVAIQPTLIEANGALHAFCRNVCNGFDNKRKSWVTTSLDNGFTWQPMKYTGIPNHNNSLVAIPKENEFYLVLNHTANRYDIVLYDMVSKNQISLATPISKKRLSFSYPNYTWVDDKLNIVHTNSGIIAWHQFDKEFLNEVFQT